MPSSPIARSSLNYFPVHPYAVANPHVLAVDLAPQLQDLANWKCILNSAEHLWLSLCLK